MKLKNWKPFAVYPYDGGYPVKRVLDACPCAVFICESEAVWFAAQANKRCREIEHTGFADNVDYRDE